MSNQSSNPFAVPKRQAPPRGMAEFSVSEVRGWVASLPTVNVGHTARSLHSKLRRLNRVDISPGGRQQILDLIQPVLLYVLDSLAGHYKREQLPLSDKALLVTELSQDLMIRMVVGSKVAANQFAEKEHSLLGNFLHKKAKVRALQSMLYYLGRILLQAYQLYQEPPRYLWKEIHNAYYWATQHELHDQRVAYPELGLEKGTSVSELYRQILLLALCGPHRLFQGDVDKIYVALNEWAQLCSLIPFSDKVPEEVRFAVYRNLDAPPAFREALGQQEGLRGWYLDTRPLSKLLMRQLEAKGGKGGGKAGSLLHMHAPLGSISSELKQRLILAWGVGFKRQDKRAHEPGEVQVAIGLNSVFVLVGGMGESVTTDAGVGLKELAGLSLEERAKFQDKALISSEWDVLSETPAAGSAVEMEGESLRRLKRIAQAHIEHCEIIDKSTHGFHLAWSGTHKIDPWVGKFVGITENAELEDGAGWKMGVIRWLCDAGEHHLEYGIEIIADSAEPVMLWYVPHGSGIREQWCSLLVPQLVGGSALVVPTFYPHEQDQIFLVRDGQEEQIRLTSVIEYTGYFSIFRYEAVSLGRGGGLDKATASVRDDEDDQFKNLWQEL